MKRLQFSLRTLLIFIAAGVVLCWAYWIGLPRWKLQLEQQRFISSVKNVKAGMTVGELDYFAAITSDRPVFYSDFVFDVSPPRATHMRSFVLGDRIYCILVVIDGEHSNDSKRRQLKHVELFDLALLPPDYADSSMVAIRGMGMYALQGPTGIRILEKRYNSYLGKFGGFLYGDRKTNPGFQYELIYSDPPAPTQPPR